MRGQEKNLQSLFSCISPEQPVPKDHPLRPIRIQPKGDGDGPTDREQGRNPTVDFRGQKPKNENQASKTDPDARRYKKAQGQQARLCYMGHALMENRNGLVVDAMVTITSGTAEREAAVMMIDQVPGKRGVAVGADKGYDGENFGDACRQFSTSDICKKPLTVLFTITFSTACQKLNRQAVLQACN
jgi:hypothetical protein